MDVLILAAGFATRLYPLTVNTPKALIKIKEKPVIEYIVESLNSLEINKIYILTNNKFHIKFSEWQERYANKEKISIITNGVNCEKEKKGAVVDLKQLLTFSDSEVFVLASDNIFSFNLKRMVKILKEKKKSSVALKEIADIEMIKKYSSVILENGKIKDFEEKSQNPKSNLCATACYLLTKEDIEKIKEHQFEEKDNLGEIIRFLHKASDVYGVIFNDFWIDIGSKEELETAEEFISTHYAQTESINQISVSQAD